MLSEDERVVLRRWSRRPKSSQALALRSRIVLACAAGVTNVAVAEELGVNKVTVGKWRARFVEHRLEGLSDEPRPGQPRKITDEMVEEVIVKTLESTPVDATHWSTRSMAKAVGLNQTAMSRIWRAFGLKPHRQDSFKLSRDPQFVERSATSWGYTSTRRSGAGVVRGRETQVQALDRSPDGDDDIKPAPANATTAAANTNDHDLRLSY